MDDNNFGNKIARNKEFSIHKIRSFPAIRNIEDFNRVANELCGKFEISLFQYFISQYLSYRTPYNSIMLYYGVGVGKTCTAITLTETILSTKIMDTTEPHIWVIMPQALEENFNKEIFNYDIKVFKDLFNQCTGDNYVKLLNIHESTFNEKDNKDNIKRLLKKRYEIFTYDSFMKRVNEKYKDNIVENKVIIIDEAHNIRSTNNKEKGVYSTLKKLLENGRNNKLILLSATPMYNEPRDILDLFNLMLINDKRDNILKEYYKVFNNNNKFKFDDKTKKLIKKLSSNYISYLKGKNPFTFALKLKASYNSKIKILNVEPTKDPSNNSIPAKELGWLKYINDDIVISKLGIFQKNKIEALKKILNKINYNSINEIDENELNDIGDAGDAGETGETGDDGGAKELSQSKSQNQNMKLLQPMNIVYENDIGRVGFNSFFRNIEGTASISVNYSEKYKNALYPTEEYLGKYSGKFLNICNIIRKSEGIVVIYSRFAWAGIIPLAICLEHLGYSREGTNNILRNPEIVADKPKYNDVSNPKYCILTSDKKEIMGSTTINNLIKKINDDRNINGKDIKVILITQVASEGLSFYNAREIHLIEPWYHFNRPDQIIGRGIRNCRHQKLPFEKRNVTVFMHASANDDVEMLKTETIDIHALRISTRKYIESKEIDKIISNNSLDCSLMKNINYFPKKIFEMGTVDILTSQGNKIKYELGDDEDLEPLCGLKDDDNDDNERKEDKSGYRSDVYKHLLKRAQKAIKNRLVRMIEDDVYYISYKELIKDIEEDIDIDEEILIYAINKSVRPTVIVDNYYIEHNSKGIKLSIINDNNNESAMAKIKIKMGAEELNDKEGVLVDDKKSENDIENILKMINIDYTNVISTTISIYFNLDDKRFKRLTEYIIVNYGNLGKLGDDNKAELMYVIKCLDTQGVFIRRKELPSYNKNNNNDYIGYVNIYNIENKNNEDIKNLDISLYNNVEKRWSESLTITEQKEFAKYRNSKIVVIPENMELEDMPWGIIEPQFIKKDNIIKNTFKIFSTDAVVGKGKKIGRVCTFYNKAEHNNFIKQIEKGNESKRNFKDIKEMLCKHIAHKLMENKKLILFPLFKPSP